MDRFRTATSLQVALSYLTNKRWTPQQLPFAEALIKLLAKEKDDLIQLGMSELRNHLTKLEKDANASEG